MQLRIQIVHTVYNEFLADLYKNEPQLADLGYEAQRQRFLDTFFGTGDAYAHGLRRLGCETDEVICNADVLQQRWSREHGLALLGNIHDERRQVVAAQIRAFRPDVLFVFEWSPLGDAFLADMKKHARLLVGQIASPLPANRTFAAYDVMLSSYPPIVEYFQRDRGRGEYLRLAFDERVLGQLGDQPVRYDVTFVGGFAPSHPDRIGWLESLLREVELDLFCYGIDRAASDSPIRARYRGQAWGLDMYRVLQQSRITLNRHARIDVGGQVVSNYANNMRLYEATGVGTCVLTEERDNLAELFEPGVEVLTYRNDDDCVEKIRRYLADEPARLRIAQAGQVRTMQKHRYTQRMEEFLGIISRRLRGCGIHPTASHAPVRAAPLPA